MTLEEAARQLLLAYKPIVRIYRSYQQEFNGVGGVFIPPQFPWNKEFKDLCDALAHHEKKND